MKKLLFILGIILVVQGTGCTVSKTSSKTNGISETEANVKKSDNDIRKIAYLALNENYKKDIINWESAKIEDYKSQDEHPVGNLDKDGDIIVDIKDKYTYKVTFRTNNEELLGPITIYINRSSYEVLGVDLRD